MALRKDKVAAALREMKGICSSPEDSNSLPNTINQLADILGDLFDDIALPELPQIDSGEFSLPEDAPFNFPTGGGDIPPFDPLGGFEGGSPGGGSKFGPGGESGGGEGGGGGGGGQDPPFQCLEIFAAKTDAEIPAASGNTPGEGFVTRMELRSIDPDDDEVWLAAFQGIDAPGSTLAEVDNCQAKCEQEHLGVPLDELDDDEIDESLELMTDCLNKCNEDVELQEMDGEQPMSVYNISCEKIEKDKNVIVSYDICQDVGYVLVEACGCDEE